MSVLNFKTDVIIYISDNTVTNIFQYQSQSIDTKNIAQSDQRKNIHCIYITN
jgi:hypothetical protein